MASYDFLSHADQLVEADRLCHFTQQRAIEIFRKTLPGCDALLFPHHDRINAQQPNSAKDERRHRRAKPEAFYGENL